MNEGYHVAILGATGAVGTRILAQLEQSTIPVKSLKLLASARSVSQTRQFKGQVIPIEEAKPASFDGVDLVLASAGGRLAGELLPEAVKRGAVAVDNSSHWRMNPNVPLIVPEVNAEALADHHGIIANPNCSTIQMVVALEPLRKAYGLKQVIVSTYQAASGAGQRAWDELLQQAQQHLNGETQTADILPTKGDVKHYPLAFNLLPQIDTFQDDGYTYEEQKMMQETKKIMFGDPTSTKVKVTATAVRVPVPVGHGESVYVTVADESATRADVQRLLATAPGVVLEDDPAHQIYPQPLNAVNKRETFVGRVRADVENPGSFNMWVVSDNLLKGAAWNTVQIAEELAKRDLFHSQA
jgi:aspartate-semialdehyde dehydrogenase